MHITEESSVSILSSTVVPHLPYVLHLGGPPEPPSSPTSSLFHILPGHYFAPSFKPYAGSWDVLSTSTALTLALHSKRHTVSQDAVDIISRTHTDHCEASTSRHLPT
jgi:hypothetical protein